MPCRFLCLPALFLEDGTGVEKRKRMVRLVGHLQFHQALIALQFLEVQGGIAIAGMANDYVGKADLTADTADAGTRLLVDPIYPANVMKRQPSPERITICEVRDE
jgi:hypothetical protein